MFVCSTTGEATVKTKDRTWSTSGVPSLDDKLTAGNASSPLTRTVRMLMSLCSDRWLYYTAEALGPGYNNITRGCLRSFHQRHAGVVSSRATALTLR